VRKEKAASSWRSFRFCMADARCARANWDSLSRQARRGEELGWTKRLFDDHDYAGLTTERGCTRALPNRF